MRTTCLLYVTKANEPHGEPDSGPRLPVSGKHDLVCAQRIGRILKKERQHLVWGWRLA